MTFKEVSEIYGLPQKLLIRLKEMGLIGEPLDAESERKIEFLSAFWGKEWFIKLELSGYSVKKRQMMARKAELNKWEGYVYQRYLNALKDGKSKRIMINEIVEELNRNYKIPVEHISILRIRQLRKRAWNHHMKMAKETGKRT